MRNVSRLTAAVAVGVVAVALAAPAAGQLNGAGVDELLAAAGSTAAQLHQTGLDSQPLLASSSVNGGGLSGAKVDDDGQQCPDAQFTTIQAAVNASAPGATVEVCPGTYNESVVVDRRLHLKGWTQKPTDEQCRAGLKGTNPTRDSIVQGGTAGPGFWVQAHEVKITNFTVQGAINPSNGPGIYLSNAFSKYEVKENIIQRNVFGIYYNTDGAEESQVEVNCIRDNNQEPLVGSASGNGIYSDQGLRNATVKDNNFTKHTNASVILAGKPGTHSRLQIEANEIVEDASIILSNLTDSTVKSNVSIESNGSGVFFSGGSSDVFVEANRIVDCAFTGVNVRFQPTFYDVVVANTRITVKGNAVDGCGDAGIRLRDGTTASSAEGNKVEDNGATAGGISLEDADNNLVKGNESIGNLRDGLWADSMSAGNRIEGNKALDNTEHDCHDDSVGTGTALTANFWIGNEGRTQNRPGLCPNATVIP